jgi:hypothetical protein
VFGVLFPSRPLPLYDVKGSGGKQDSLEGEQGKTDNKNNSGFQRQDRDRRRGRKWDGEWGNGRCGMEAGVSR